MSKRDKIELKELESLPEALDGNHRVIPIVTGEDDTVEEVAVPEILPVLTLRSSVLFPGAITPVTVDWFEATVDWLGSEIALDFDRGVPEEMASAQETGRALMASQADWDHRVRSYAAQELLSLAND